jgi:hypothetical protein
MSYCDQRSSQIAKSQLIHRPYQPLSPLGEKSKDQSAYLVNRQGATAAQNSASVWRMRHYLIQARRRSRLELIHLLPATDGNARLARRVGTSNRVLVESPLSDLLNLMWTCEILRSNRCPGRQRRLGAAETAARRHADSRAGAGASVEALARSPSAIN